MSESLNGGILRRVDHLPFENAHVNGDEYVLSTIDVSLHIALEHIG